MVLFTGPSEPQNLEVTSSSTSSLSLQWDEPEELNGILTNYTISWWRTDGKDGKGSKELPYDTQAYTITGLKQNKEYEVELSVSMLLLNS